MKNPFKRKPKDKVDWKKIAQELELKCKGLETSISAFARLDEANLRLIHELRQMDQGTFQISQVAPDWKRIQPIFQRMFEATEKRMATENSRIRNLMVGEIRQAYNEPGTIPIASFDKLKDYKGTYEGVPVYEVPKLEDKS